MSESAKEKALAALKAAQQAKRASAEPALFELIRKGDRTALSRGITLVESQLLSDFEKADKLIAQCAKHAGGALRLGITGVPGVGKSSFIEQLGLQLAEQGHRIAVLAIDPSSEISGGSILGDKTRMEKLSAHKNVFIRPSPTSGTLGGVAGSTRESMLLYEAAGFDIIIVETVGVGQSETAVHHMVDCFLLLLLPGAGDELQGIKRGIVEMADIMVVNKADLLPEKAKDAAGQYARALHLFPPRESGWIPPVLTASALSGLGLDDVWTKVIDFQSNAKSSGAFERNRLAQSLSWFEDRLKSSLSRAVFAQPEMRRKLPEWRDKVAAGSTHPVAAATALLKEIE